jgi:outer membrane lipoprotein SlyB
MRHDDQAQALASLIGAAGGALIGHQIESRTSRKATSSGLPSG